MIPGIKRRKATGPIGVFVRLAVIMLLGACAWWVWVKDPLNPERQRAAQFCESVTADMSPVEIMQAASAKGATGFGTPRPEELVVYFGKSACGVEIDAGRGAGG
jgi:hypothetical protein